MKNEKQKTIIVTGGAGFIGSNLIEELVRQGENVISLDNYFTGFKENHIPGAEYREGHTKDIERHIFEVPDIIYHLGEYSRVAASLDEPGLVLDLNAVGTFGVLEFWRKHRCKLVYAGSSTKFTEARADGTQGRDLSPYTWVKAANSELVRNYSRWYGLDYVNVYFYNVYGPRERAKAGVGTYGSIIGTFKQCYLEGEPYPVREPGTQTRAFTYVGDAVSGIILAGEKGAGDGYDICSQDVYSILDVANMFGGDIKMLPPTKSSRSSGSADSEKIKAFGWKQTKTLKEYIEAVKKQKIA